MRLLLRPVWLCVLVASVAGWWQLGRPLLAWQGGTPASVTPQRLAQRAPAGSLAVLAWSDGSPAVRQGVDRWLRTQFPPSALRFDEFRSRHSGASGYASVTVGDLPAAQRALNLWLAVPSASLPLPLPGLQWTVALQSSDLLRFGRELDAAGDAFTRTRVGSCWLYEGKEGQPSFGLGEGMIWVGSSASGVQACLESAAHPAGEASSNSNSTGQSVLVALNSEAVAPLWAGHPADTLPLPELVPVSPVHSVAMKLEPAGPPAGELFLEGAFKPRPHSLPLTAATVVPRSWPRLLSLRPCSWALQLAAKWTGLDSTVLAGWGIEEVALAQYDAEPSHVIVLLRPRLPEAARSYLLPISRFREAVDPKVHEAYRWDRRGHVATICWWAALPGKQPTLAFQAAPELAPQFLTLLDGAAQPWAAPARQGAENWAAELHQFLPPGSPLEPGAGGTSVLHAQAIPENSGLRLRFSVAPAEAQP